MRVETGSRIVIGDVCDDVAGLESGYAFMLFVDDGLIVLWRVMSGVTMNCLRMFGRIGRILFMSPIC